MIRAGQKCVVKGRSRFKGMTGTVKQYVPYINCYTIVTDDEKAHLLLESKEFSCLKK